MGTVMESIEVITTFVVSVAALGFVAFLFYVGVCYRAQIAQLLGSLIIRVKRGDTEVSVEAYGAPRLEYESPAEGTAVLEQEPSAAAPVEVELGQATPSTPDEWRQEMVKAFRAGEIAQAEGVFEKLQQSEPSAAQKLRNRTIYHYLQFTCQDPSALAALHELAKKPEVASDAYHAIGLCYEDTGDFEKAAQAYEMSAQAYGQEDEEQLSNTVVRAAACLFKLGKRQEAYGRLMQGISQLTVPDALFALYEGLASLYEDAKDAELRALALEKALEIKPNDTRVRFGAAYSYAEKNLDRLALLHYKTLLQLDADEAPSLNNIGVAYSRLQMPIRAVRSYKAAARLNNTLAAGNLALSFIRAGFAEEAVQSISDAKQQEKTDPQVGRAMTTISAMDEDEGTREDLYVSAAREQERFLLSFAGAYFTGEVATPSFAGTWSFSDGAEATITQGDSHIEANWLHENSKYRFTGGVNNRGAQITTYKMRYSLGKEVDFGDDGHGYAYLSRDGQQLFVMILRGQEHSLERLTRCEGDF